MSIYRQLTESIQRVLCMLDTMRHLNVDNHIDREIFMSLDYTIDIGITMMEKNVGTYDLDDNQLKDIRSWLKTLRIRRAQIKSNLKKLLS